MTESAIHKNVMRRVRTIHAVRPLASTTALSAFLLLGGLWGIGTQVWVAQVYANMPSVADVGALARFAIAAFANTEFIVQALTLVVLAAAVWIVRDGVRSLRYSLRTT
ncbi:MAG TPA: hypothetical protein VEA36_00845 [Candidatus Paceibacterota bacterium]|nr:hypothetical protein [Candidatus Paceibacterota bacterium]